MAKNTNDYLLYVLVDSTLANAVVLSYELHMMEGGGRIYSKLKNSVMAINLHF